MEQTRDVPDCVFCRIVADLPAADDANLTSDLADIVYADGDVVAFLDRAPVFKGHVLVVPRAHVDTLPDLPATSLASFFGVVQRVAAAVPDDLLAPGFIIPSVFDRDVPYAVARAVGEAAVAEGVTRFQRNSSR